MNATRTKRRVKVSAIFLVSFIALNSSRANGQCTPELVASDAATDDRFGGRVFIDEDVAIISAAGVDDGGAAYIFRFDGLTWNEEQKLTASDSETGHGFGYSVSVSGDLAIVGAVGDDHAGPLSGSAYVFNFDGTNWVEMQKLTASDAAANDDFGVAVAISDDTALVGAWRENGGVGAAYVFRFDGVNWLEEQKLVGSDTSVSSVFGQSVFLSGQTVLVGAPGDRNSGFPDGSVFIYEFDGTNWIEEQKLTAPPGGGADDFGITISASGDVAIIGEHLDRVDNIESGSAHIFRFNGSTWVYEQLLLASDPASFDFFGGAVSVFDDTAVIGARKDSDDGPESGSVYVFRFDGSNWDETVKLTAYDAVGGDWFGVSVFAYADTLMVGAPEHTESQGPFVQENGAVYVYGLTGFCIDDDCDGFGFPGDASCPNGDLEDCNDQDPGVYPGNTETQCNGVDDDCNPVTIDDSIDVDNDGFGACVDCNDNNPDVNPGVTETICNGIDDDCDPLTPDAFDGMESDCNRNGELDGCDVLAGISRDCNATGVLDECEPTTKFFAPDAELGDYFGHAVAISGDAAVIGVAWDDDSGFSSGSAHIFRFDGAGWVHEQELTATDGETGDEFGFAVSVDGDTALVAAIWDDDGAMQSGAVYVYRFNGSVWVEEQKLKAADAEAGDKFGESVSISGDVAAIGSSLDDDSGPSSGAAYVFRFDGSTWVEEQKLTASDATSHDLFGYGVAISDDTIIVGASSDDAPWSGSGSAYVFRFDGANWAEEQKLVASDGDVADFFGEAVSIDGDLAVVASRFNDDADLDAGAVYVFRFDGSNWMEEQKLVAFDAELRDEFGISVSVSGNHAVVGAYGDDDWGSSSGSAYLFEYDGLNWNHRRKITAADGAPNVEFGRSVAIDGEAIIIGAWRDDAVATDSGSAYVLHLNPTDVCTDNDCDGYGNPNVMSCATSGPDDCNDNDPTIFPGNTETPCNGIDDDCDPATPDEGDVDDDGFTNCVDCDDSNPDVFPGNDELPCNEIDDDCDPGTPDIPAGLDGDCNANGEPDICDIVNGILVDADDNGIPDECETAAPLAAEPPHDVAKNRYVSFQPDSAAVVVAFEIALPDGRTGYVGEPAFISDRGSDFQWVADVVDTPVYRSWDEQPLVHVRGCVIYPDQVYEIRRLTGVFTSLPLLVPTTPDPVLAGTWADCVGTFDSGAGMWTGPNDATNFNDIAASIDQFQQKGTNPVTWTDIAEVTPNYITNFGDIGAVIHGFQENNYWSIITCCDSIEDCEIPSP